MENNELHLYFDLGVVVANLMMVKNENGYKTLEILSRKLSIHIESFDVYARQNFIINYETWDLKARNLNGFFLFNIAFYAFALQIADSKVRKEDIKNQINKIMMYLNFPLVVSEEYYDSQILQSVEGTQQFQSKIHQCIDSLILGKKTDLNLKVN